MIKNILAGSFLVFYVLPGFCIDAFYMDNVAPRQAIENAIHDDFMVRVTGEAVQKAIEIVTQDGAKRIELANLYDSWTQDGSPLSFGALDNICDIAFGDNKDQCQIFATALLKSKALRLYSVCNADKGKTVGTERCINDFFDKTKIDATAGRALASEYARVKYNDSSLECDKNVKINKTGSDYMRCVSQGTNNVFYEFKFDSLADVHIDENREDAIFGAICRLHGLEYARTMLSGYANPRCKTTDKDICAKINKSLTPFGFESKIGAKNWGADYGAQIASPECVINALCTARNVNDLKRAFGLDPLEFQKSSVQVNRNEYLEDMLANYVQSKVGNVTSLECNATHQCINVNGKKSDVLGCRVNGKDVDFVFKDLSEWSRYRDNAGRQVIQCKIVGGEFTGQDCVYLTHEQCDKLAKQTIPGCPECTNVVWDTKHNICKLRTNEILNDIEKAEKASMMAIGSAAAVATGVGVAYAAYQMGSTTMAIPVALALANAAGSVMELYATLKIWGVTEDFVRESQNCNSSSCADRLVETWLRRLSNLRKELTDAEYNFVNKELARLIGLTSAEFGKKMFTNLVKKYATDSTAKNDITSAKAQRKMDEMLNSPDLLSANSKDFFDSDSWEPEQVWRAVGVGLQIASTLGSIAYSFWESHKAYKAYDDETTALLRDALNDGKNNLSPEERREIMKYMLAEGKPIQGNGNIKLPEGPIKLGAVDVAYDDLSMYDTEQLKELSGDVTDTMEKYNTLNGASLLDDQRQYSMVRSAANQNFAKEEGIAYFNPKAGSLYDYSGGNSDKLITAEVRFDVDFEDGHKHLRDALEKAKSYDKAVIPVSFDSGPGARHVVPVVVENGKVTVIDQYALNSPYIMEKKLQISDAVREVFGENKGIMTNFNQLCDNQTGYCSLFVGAVEKNVLGNSGNSFLAPGKTTMHETVDYFNKTGAKYNQNFIEAAVVNEQIDMYDRTFQYNKFFNEVRKPNH